MTSASAAQPRPLTAPRIAAFAFAGFVALLGLAYVADLAFASGKLPRNAYVAGVPLGGKTPAEAERLVAERFAQRAAQPIAVRAADVTATIDPKAAGLELDAAATVAGIEGQGLNPLDRARALFGKVEAPVVAKVDEAKLAAAVERLAKTKVDRRPREGAVVFDGLTPRPVVPQTGRTTDVPNSADRVAAAYLRSTGPVELAVTVTPVKSTAAAVTEALENVAKPAVASSVTLTAPSRRLVVTPRQVAKLLTIKADATGAVVPAIDPKALDKELRTAFETVEKKPVDADFNLVGGKVVISPSALGTKVDAAALTRGLLAALPQPAPREVALPLVQAEPKLSTERAQSLGIKEIAGTFTTYHPCCRPRVQNIHRIADIVDGAVVLPGETFSLNGYVGERTRGKGFVEAPMILNGRFVDAVGGGVSQFATTMYNAVFFSGMKDVYHKAHSYYISRYPAGREATVSAPAPDLKWQNDSPYGVLVKTSYTDRSITVTFWSTKRYDIESITGARSRVRGFPTKYESGRNCSSMGGAQGFDIVVWRVFKQGGKEVKRERIFTRYLPEPRVICGRRPAPRPSSSPPASPKPSSSPSPSPSG